LEAEVKITRLEEKAIKELTQQWEKNAKHMADADRPLENLAYLLSQDGGDSQWYVVGETDVVFFIRNVTPGLSAVFYSLNLEEAEPAAAKDEIRAIMREFDLRRLTYTIPTPIVSLARVAQRVGFWPEGRMKDAVLYDGKYTDLDLFGFYRAEVEDGKVSISGPAAIDPGKPKKRRRRSRRKKKKVAPKGN
jgi:hypothetical protein